MSPERYKRLGHIYHAALEVELESRAAFLDSACGGDEDLRREVESLLDAHEKVGDYFASPAVDVAAKLVTLEQNQHLVGQCLSHYRVLSFISAGGMGEVYLAEDTRLNRRVAIKILPPELVEDERAGKRLLREAQAAARLDHANICAIHEITEEDGRSFIVMQYVEGETLATRMQRKSLELREAMNVAIQVADALSEAHSRGIIHRDIKPANIMVTARGQVKVMDFGLARVIQEKSGLDSETLTRSLLTDPGTVVGTVPYMSPEQVQGEALDARSDIFSLGAVVYEMISGHKPFEAGSAAAVLSAILTKEPLPLARYAPDVPAELERIIRKCLEKNRERRYQVMRDVAIDLENLGDEQASARVTAMREELATAGVHAAVTDKVPQQSGVSSSRLRFVFYGLAALLVVAVLAYGLLFLWGPATGRPQIKSIAVLPLDNLSGDPAQEYLADGMTESLITELSKIGSLRVISRTSVMQYKAARKPLPEIGRELNVDVIVAGSVQRSGDKLGITAQLIRAATDQHLWADQYERELRDVLSLQREVARAIAGEINVKLTPKEAGLLASGRPVNPEALDSYLKGRDHLNRGKDLFLLTQGLDLLKTSVDYFEKAIRIDPNFALAYVGLAAAHPHLAGWGTPKEHFQRAKEAAERALEIDETLAEAHSSLAYILMVLDWDWAGAEREYKRAIELNPNSAGTRFGYATHLLILGRHDQAVREIDLAQELDPLAISIKHDAGFFYSFARQHDRAIEQYRRLVDIEPNNFRRHAGLGLAYINKGMYNEGIAALRKASDLSGRDASRDLNLAWGYAVAGNRSEAIKILDESLKRLTSGESVSKVAIAQVYTALGDRDQAFAWLEKAYQERSRPLLYILKSDPSFDSLRSDPRYHDLVRRIGFPQ